MRMHHLIPLALALTAACDKEPAAPLDPVEELAADVRSATAGYASPDAAAADGFVVVSPCVAPDAGGMGFHYLLESRLDEVVVGTAPELLLYAPNRGGELELVGVEYMVLAPAWDAVNASPPELLGNTFADHRAEEDLLPERVRVSHIGCYRGGCWVPTDFGGTRPVPSYPPGEGHGLHGSLN